MPRADVPMTLEQKVIDLEGQVESLEADLAEARQNEATLVGRFTVCATEARAEIDSAELALTTAKQSIDEMPREERR